MNQATKPISNRIAIIFDFDRTIIPCDSFYVLLEDCGIDKDDFYKNYVNPLLEDDWQHYLARSYGLVKESNGRKTNKITKSTLTDLGKKIQLCKGVERMFDRLEQKMTQIDQDIELEFYLMSGGFVDIARSTSIAKYFKGMWGCELHYNENEKDLIYHYRDIPPEEIRIPINQVIDVADCTSDIPCFTVMNQYGGIALGVHPEDKTGDQWKHADEITSNQKLTNLVPANYQENSETMNSICLAMESIAQKINLSKHQCW